MMTAKAIQQSMPTVYQCELEVRGYELDLFGHVNHAMYIRYLEHARWKLLEDEGITLEDFARIKLWPVIAHVEISYLQPTFLADVLKIQTCVSEFTKSSFTFQQEIFRRGKPVVKAKIRAAMVNGKGRPARIPREISRIWDSSR